MALTKVSTPAIKDEAITLAKLLHGDSNSNGKFLRANNGADPTFETIDLTALSASNLTSGTIPDARFPATLPAASAANLTNIPAANITGTLPAIDGSNLTGITSTTINNNADNRLITGSGTANTLEGEDKLTWNGNNLHIERTVAAYLQPRIDIYNSGAYGWGGAIRFNANWANTQEHQAQIRTYGGSDKDSASLAFEVGASGSEKVRILPTGGITFNGDTATANALDDYEEGTWTVVVKPAANQSAWTYGASNDYELRSATASGATDTASYTKIGNRVFISFSIYINTGGTSRLNFSLPYAIKGNDYQVSGHLGYYKVAGSTGVGFLGSGLSSIDIFELDGDGNHPNLSYASNTELYINLQYETN